MEPFVFLEQPQRTVQLNIMSWNINEVHTKFEKTNIQTLLCDYDIVCLNEVKTSINISFPGYVTYMSINKSVPHRGGTAVLIKSYLEALISSIDVSICDQIWIEIKSAPIVLLGFCYIPPSDSVYYSHEHFSAIQEKIKSRPYDSCLLMGDFNSRFGSLVRCLPDRISNSEVRDFSYPILPDDVPYANDNATILNNLCIDSELLVVNNLKTPFQHFSSKKTFRRGDNWISEIDTCLASLDLIKNLSRFCVLQTNYLPSDHAPLSICVRIPSENRDWILSRAALLGDHAAVQSTLERQRLAKKPLASHKVDKQMFTDKMLQTQSPEFSGSIDGYVDEISETIYKCARESKSVSEEIVLDHLSDRWERILQDRDDSRVWKAVNWNGDFETRKDDTSSVSDEDFKEFFEKILNPQGTEEVVMTEFECDIYIPILDDPITYEEIETEMNKMNPDKACGPDGISPGLFKCLPVQWLMTILTLFNTIFRNHIYQKAWTVAKLFTVFKKGNRCLADNYRGISVISAIAKLYDMILCSRLKKWFIPYREQAGAQEKRGCLEHIVTLRLLIDFAKRKKQTLFVTFVDFSKAYDMVPRKILFTIMKRLGCGTVMLLAINAMYQVTRSIIGTAIITATIGVRQGSPTSCLLFVLYINDLIKIIKENSRNDGFLSWLHVLVLMDDTVILATTRNSMIYKVSLLRTFCQSYGMKINQSKTKFFVIGGNPGDSLPLNVDDLIIESCTSYTYLGSIFTSDGLVTSSVKAHAQNKMCQVLKFISFLKKNNDVPFVVKRRVFDAALMSSLLYGCESWLNADLRPMVKLYNWAIKQLLGVRMTTCNDLCYIEVGYPPLKDLVIAKQRKFLAKMWAERSSMDDDPLVFAIRTVINAQYKTSNYINRLMNSKEDDLGNAMEKLKTSIRESQSSKRCFYKLTNPDLITHDIYKGRHLINEFHRMSFSRFRLSSHSLAVETGRWNRQGGGPVPLEERVCICGEGIQTERHVIEVCPLTQIIRSRHQLTTLEHLFSSNICHKTLCQIIHDMLRIFK